MHLTCPHCASLLEIDSSQAGMVMTCGVCNRHFVSPPTAMSHSTIMPIGSWIGIGFPGRPLIVGFTYIDPEAGFSAQGFVPDGNRLDHIIVRLPTPKAAWRPLSETELQQYGLETPPDWVMHYGPQPARGAYWGWWQKHPKLQGRFHPEYPDDLRVLVHDYVGEPDEGIFAGQPELMWVRVTGGDGDLFQGRLLNQPHKLQSVRQGDNILFVVREGADHPIRA